LISNNLFCLKIITKLLLFSSNRWLSTGFIIEHDGTPGHSAQCTELAAGQLSRFHHKKPVATKFVQYKASGHQKFLSLFSQQPLTKNFCDEIWTVGPQPVLCTACYVCGVQCWRLNASLKKLKTIVEVNEALQVIWGNLPQGLLDKAVKDFSN